MAFNFAHMYLIILKVWTETPHGGEVNFITGAGGFLQSVLFGYGGIRLNLDGLYIDPSLPDGCSQISLNGIAYFGNKINYSYDSNQVNIIITEQIPPYKDLVLVIIKSQKHYNLSLNKLCSFNREKAVIKLDK